MKQIVVESVQARLAREANPGECWLWCDECHRFFQRKSVRRDACPFSDCCGYGVGFNLLMWDDRREPEDVRWPRSIDELEHGMRSPDMELFHAVQLDERIDHLLGEMMGSAEMDALDGESPRYLGAFLKMMSDLSWDITRDDDGGGFDDMMAAELVGELPVWSRTADPAQVPRMLRELRAFFRFAARTGRVRHAARWLDVVSEAETAERLRHTMRHDRRLRAASRTLVY
jgi:hypothetical protein